LEAKLSALGAKIERRPEQDDRPVFAAPTRPVIPLHTMNRRAA
jgi:hypothetical protein